MVAWSSLLPWGPCLSLQEWEERRRQNIEKMNEEMEKIAEYERNQRVSAGASPVWAGATRPGQPANRCPSYPQEGVLEPNPVRNFLDDPRRRGGPLEEPERDRREGSRRHGRNWGGPDFERVRCGLEQERQVRVGGGAPRARRPAAALSLGQRAFLGALSARLRGEGGSRAWPRLSFTPR